MRENQGWDGAFTSEEGGEVLDIGNGCGDGIPLSARFVITDPNKQRFLDSRTASGRSIAIGAGHEEGRLQQSNGGGGESGRD